MSDYVFQEKRIMRQMVCSLEDAWRAMTCRMDDVYQRHDRCRADDMRIVARKYYRIREDIYTKAYKDVNAITAPKLIRTKYGMTLFA